MRRALTCVAFVALATMASVVAAPRETTTFQESQLATSRQQIRLNGTVLSYTPASG